MQNEEIMEKSWWKLLRRPRQWSHWSLICSCFGNIRAIGQAKKLHSSGTSKEKDLTAPQNKGQVSLVLLISLTLSPHTFILKVLRTSKLFADFKEKSFVHRLIEEAAKNNTLGLGFTYI